MDEIDGMNSGDKGGINALIKLIRPKKTKKQKKEQITMTPIICIGNYHIDKKLGPALLDANEGGSPEIARREEKTCFFSSWCDPRPEPNNVQNRWLSKIVKITHKPSESL